MICARGPTYYQLMIDCRFIQFNSWFLHKSGTFPRSPVLEPGEPRSWRSPRREPPTPGNENNTRMPVIIDARGKRDPPQRKCERGHTTAKVYRPQNIDFGGASLLGFATHPLSCWRSPRRDPPTPGNKRNTHHVPVMDATRPAETRATARSKSLLDRQNSTFTLACLGRGD